MRLLTMRPFLTLPYLRRTLSTLAALLLVCAWPAHADDKAKDELPPPLFGEGHLQQRAAASLAGSSIGEGGPLRQAVLLVVGQETGCWEFDSPMRGEAVTPYGAAAVLLGSTPGNAASFSTPLMLFAGDAANCWSLEDMTSFRPLDPRVLASVRDNQPLASLSDRTRAAVEETYIFQDALLKVLRIQHEVFERVSRANVTAEELEETPSKFRGEVLKLNGELRRIRQVTAPPLLRRFGAPKLFEVWISVRSREIKRLVCVLTPLAFGIAPTNDPPVKVELTVTGYFFKKVRFSPADGVAGQPDRTVPLIVGHVTPFVGQEVLSATAAVAVLGAEGSPFTGPLASVAGIHAGEGARCWTIRDPARAEPLDSRYLDAVKDGAMLPFNFERAGITEREQKDQAEKLREVFAYWDAVIKSNRTKLEVFQGSLRKEVAFVHLHNEPQRYRGDVVRLSGHLRRVRQFEPSLYERQGGVKNVYEVWLVDDSVKSAPPALMICTELPPGIKVAETVSGLVPVEFVGYFFKKYLFKPAEAKSDKDYRVAPMLIGRLVYEPKQADEESSGWMRMLVPFILVTLAGTFIIVFLMTWVFRRADRRVLARVGTVNPFVSASEPEPPPPPPAETPPPA